ncbi:MAG: protein translocase subunit SecD, partial [Pseudomonadota bacterium]
MVHIPRWLTVLVLLVSAFAVVYAAPNLLDRDRMATWSDSVPDWVPGKQINLGLDLQGGSHLLLRVGWETLEGERLQSVISGLRRSLAEERIGYTGLGVSGNAAVFTLRDPSRAGEVPSLLAEIDPDVEIEIAESGSARVTFTEIALENLRDTVIAQSIEIVRRRIDELGTNEPNIQRQGDERILVQLPGVDDPERVKDLLGQTAKLTFQFVDENTPVQDALAGSIPPGSELIEAHESERIAGAGTHYVIRKNIIVGGESLVDAQPTFQDNQPVVSFRFDSIGGRRFGEATRENVGRRFA